ncbi:3-hydroxyacyl-CoA dehydrogenase NAD-binding domain-containing protein [Nocardioides sp. AN3]
MDIDEVEQAAVVGAGTIGLSWAALFAAQGVQVAIFDPRPDLPNVVEAALEEFGPHLADQGLDVSRIFDKVQVSPDLKSAVRDAEIVQENGPERIDVKQDLFRQLIDLTSSETLLLSSSSALPASRIVEHLADGSRVLIGHPFNPPHILPLVEVVPSARTDAHVVDRAVDFYRQMDRVPVVQRKEISGFVGNRLQNALIREAIYLVEQGVVTPAELDSVVTNSLGLRWATVGPFLGWHLGGGEGGYRHMDAHIGEPMRKMWDVLGAPSRDPESVERMIEAVEQTYGTSGYPSLAEGRDRRQVALLSAMREASADDAATKPSEAPSSVAAERL